MTHITCTCCNATRVCPPGMTWLAKQAYLHDRVHLKPCQNNRMVQPSMPGGLHTGSMGTPMHKIMENADANGFLMSSSATLTGHCDKPMPVNKILRDATRMERQRLASGGSRHMFFSRANSTSQVGWHVHGTHVFVIPVVATGKVVDASTNTDGVWPPPGNDWPKASAVEEVDDSENGSSKGGEGEEDSRTAAPGPYYVHFIPNIRASHAWWTQRPEFNRWLHAFSFHHSVHHTPQGNWDCDNNDALHSNDHQRCVAEACSNAHQDLLRRVDLLKNVLARWDHHARVYRAVHAPHEYMAPPGPTAAAQGWWQQQQQQKKQQQQQTSDDRYTSPVARVIRLTVRQQQPRDMADDYNGDKGLAAFSCWAWFLVVMLLIFVVLAFVANANWHWEGVVIGDAASILAYLLLGVVLLALIGWAVWTAMSPSPSSSSNYSYAVGDNVPWGRVRRAMQGPVAYYPDAGTDQQLQQWDGQRRGMYY